MGGYEPKMKGKNGGGCDGQDHPGRGSRGRCAAESIGFSGLSLMRGRDRGRNGLAV